MDLSSLNREAYHLLTTPFDRYRPWVRLHVKSCDNNAKTYYNPELPLVLQVTASFTSYLQTRPSDSTDPTVQKVIRTRTAMLSEDLSC